MKKNTLYNLASIIIAIFIVFLVIITIITILDTTEVLRIYVESFDTALFSALLSATVAIISGKFLLSYLGSNDQKIKNMSSGTIFYNTLSNQEKKEIVDGLEAKIIEQSSENFITKVHKKINDKLANFSELNIATNTFNSTIDRLNLEIVDLKKRGNLNLVLGIIITVLGIGFLWFYVLNSGIDYKDFNEYTFFYFFLPRLSLVILIEIFAYFFLKLYKQSLIDIKFYQNEITNIESKLTAIQLSYYQKNQEERICIIRDLVSIDRNHKTELDLKKQTLSGDNIKALNETIKIIGDVISKNKNN